MIICICEALKDIVNSWTNFFWQVLSPSDRTALVENIADHLRHAQEFIQKRAVGNFNQVDPEFGSRVQQILDQYNKKIKVCSTEYKFKFFTIDSISAGEYILFKVYQFKCILIFKMRHITYPYEYCNLLQTILLTKSEHV